MKKSYVRFPKNIFLGKLSYHMTRKHEREIMKKNQNFGCWSLVSSKNLFLMKIIRSSKFDRPDQKKKILNTAP